MTDEENTTDHLIAYRLLALRRLHRLMWLAIVLPLLGLFVLAVVLHERAFVEAGQRLDRSARIAQEHALKLFDTNQMLLQRMLDALGDRNDAQTAADGADLHRRLQAMAAPLPQVQGIYVMDADGRMLASNRVFPPNRGIDYTDREWYAAHRAGTGSVYFTPQIVSRATGEPAFDMSQRREIQGAFGGTVHVSLRPSYLVDFYKELAQIEPGLRMVLMRHDGALIARWPDPAPVNPAVAQRASQPQKIEAGSRAGNSSNLPSNTVAQVRSARPLGDFPLQIVASLDRSTVLAAWAAQLGVIALMVVPASLALASSARLSIRRARDEIQTLRRLADETARRQRVEVSFLQSQKLEAMGRLTGGVAHDFNNLLAVVSTNVELIRRLPPQVPRDRQINAIGRAVSSGTKLTRQLLAFARKQALLPEHVSLQARLPALLDLLRPLLGSSTVIAIEVDTSTPLIEVDSAELELALINLAINAGDAMKTGGKLSITARQAASAEVPSEVAAAWAGAYVVIDVDDTGPGVDPAVAAQVFEPFFTTKPVGQGTGLGLSQVRAFCQSAGGEAMLLAAPGGGARARLILRASLPGVQHSPAPEAALAVLNAKVLLVEDNDEVADATLQLLEAMGAHVVRVADAASALKLIEDDGPRVDVLLSDIEMPGGMDGIALATTLLTHPQRVPVVLMSGYAQRLDEAVRQKFQVLPKPVSAVVLAEALRQASAPEQVGS
ncbi:MAG: response regulator [Chitinophagaceae bacterium]|nr:response regulator [Rubrivivax sp.]